MELKSYIDVSEEVLQALQDNQAIVALESSIISHRIPYPQSLETAERMEKKIRENGAVPVMVAVIEGRIKIGLKDKEKELLAISKDVIKIRRKDLPYVISQRKNGGTTVASSMILASLADIEVFVTGEIGGVHRGAQETLSIPDDLQEMIKTNMAVVTSGPKSMLDLERTFQYLKKNGVPIVGYGIDYIPLFYNGKSSYPVDYRLDSPLEVAELLYIKWDVIGIDGSVVIFNPVSEDYASEEKYIESVIQKALLDAKEKNVSGEAIASFLLKRVPEMAGGYSLTTSMEMVVDNARVGALIANQLQELKNKDLIKM